MPGKLQFDLFPGHWCNEEDKLPMVLLSMTPATVAAVEDYHKLIDASSGAVDATGPSLDSPAVGNPISHTQLVVVSRALRTQDEQGTLVPCRLDELLRGSRVYYGLPKAKAEPVGAAPSAFPTKLTLEDIRVQSIDGPPTS